MANTLIQIKRSTTTAVPPNASLSEGEQAYSFASNTLFIGAADGVGVIAIGGKYFIDIANTANDRAIAAFDKANSTTYNSNVVISVTDNTNAALRITQTGTGHAILVEDDANPDSTPFVISNTGAVGIGTITPYTPFDVRGTTDQYSFQVPTSGSARYVRSQAGLASYSGYNLGLLHLSGTFDSYSTVYNGAMIGALNASAWSNTNSPADMILSTTSFNSTTPSEKVRITSNGNVGIGITSPSHKLSVNGSIHITAGENNRIWSGTDNLRLGSYPQLAVSDTLHISGGQQSITFGGTGLYATIGSTVPWDFARGVTPQGIRIYGTYTDVSNYERINLTANSSGHYIIGQQAGTGSARPLYLGANNATAVTIDTAGRVGINTTLPTEKLQVEGNAIINGNVAVGGTITLENAFEFNSTKNTAKSNTDTVVSTFTLTKYRGGKFTIVGRSGTESHITELLLTHNFSNTFYTEYGSVYTSISLFTVSSDILGDNVRVILTPSSSVYPFNFDVLEQKLIADLILYDSAMSVILDRANTTIEARAA